MRVQLFMLMSIDGKISTGADDSFDFDKDIATDSYLSQGVDSYYQYETHTAPFSVIGGKTVTKLGANDGNWPPAIIPVTFVVFDNTHLTPYAITSISSKCQQLILVTKNPALISAAWDLDNVFVYGKADIPGLLDYLHTEFGADWVTLQGGATLNKLWLDTGVVTDVDIFIAPTIIGGHDTPTLVDGDTIRQLRFNNFKLADVVRHRNDYVQLIYTAL